MADYDDPGVPEGTCTNCGCRSMSPCEPDDTHAGELECEECGVCFTHHCSLCDREIPEQEAPALCRTCAATCRGYARVIQAEMDEQKEAGHAR